MHKIHTISLIFAFIMGGLLICLITPLSSIGKPNLSNVFFTTSDTNRENTPQTAYALDNPTPLPQMVYNFPTPMNVYLQQDYEGSYQNPTIATTPINTTNPNWDIYQESSFSSVQVNIEYFKLNLEPSTQIVEDNLNNVLLSVSSSEEVYCSFMAPEFAATLSGIEMYLAGGSQAIINIGIYPAKVSGSSIVPDVSQTPQMWTNAVGDSLTSQNAIQSISGGENSPILTPNAEYFLQITSVNTVDLGTVKTPTPNSVCLVNNGAGIAPLTINGQSVDLDLELQFNPIYNYVNPADVALTVSNPSNSGLTISTIISNTTTTSGVYSFSDSSAGAYSFANYAPNNYINYTFGWMNLGGLDLNIIPCTYGTSNAESLTYFYNNTITVTYTQGFPNGASNNFILWTINGTWNMFLSGAGYVNPLIKFDRIDEGHWSTTPAAVGVEPAGTGNWYWGQDLTNAVAAADSQDSSQIVIPTGYCENGEWVLQFDTSNAVIYVMTDQYGSSQPLQPISGLYVDLPTDIEVTFGNTGPYPMLSWYFLSGLGNSSVTQDDLTHLQYAGRYISESFTYNTYRQLGYGYVLLLVEITDDMHFPTGLGYLSLYFYPQLQIVLDFPNPFHCIRNGQTMTVNGHVIDGRNTPVDNFPIEITDPASGKVITVTQTNSQGEFQYFV